MVSNAANKSDASTNTIRPCDEDERKCAAKRPARAAIMCGSAHLGKPDKTRPGDEDERKCAARRPATAAITCGPAHLEKPDKTRPRDEDERKCVGEAATR